MRTTVNPRKCILSMSDGKWRTRSSHGTGKCEGCREVALKVISEMRRESLGQGLGGQDGHAVYVIRREEIETDEQ